MTDGRDTEGRDATTGGEIAPGSFTLDSRLSGALGGRTAQASSAGSGTAPSATCSRTTRGATPCAAS